MYKNPRVGDRVRLIEGFRYAGCEIGEIGTVTWTDEYSFHVNGESGCSSECWELASLEEEALIQKANEGFRALVELADRFPEKFKEARDQFREVFR
jgi:hypothetical protein